MAGAGITAVAAAVCARPPSAITRGNGIAASMRLKNPSSGCLSGPRSAVAVRLELAALDAHRPTLAAVAMRLAAVLDNPNAYTAYCAASARLIEVMNLVRRYSKSPAGPPGA